MGMDKLKLQLANMILEINPNTKTFFYINL